MKRPEEKDSTINETFDPVDALPVNAIETLPARAIDRRAFLKAAGLVGLAAACPLRVDGPGSAAAAEGGDGAPDKTSDGGEDRFVVEARYYEKMAHKKIRCTLCPRECVIDDMERGYCGVRENREGVYYTLVHSRPCTYHADPVEKKPLFHFRPGTLAFSIATAGCNVNCKFCQNWEISQVRPEQVRSIYMPPANVAELAGRYRCDSIAYTYSEPIVFYEYMMDAARAGHERGISSVVITGGYISTDPLKELCRNVDAIKVDLKSFSEDFYHNVVKGSLRPVLDGLVTIRKAGTWTEIVYLVIPTLNDSDKEFGELSRWIREHLGTDVPIHFSRFHPQYLIKNLPPTPLKTLERAREIAEAEGLEYVYIGNVPGHPAENTYCPGCRRTVVERTGYKINSINLEDGKCKQCNREIAGIWGT